jgi:galactokinase
MRAAEQPQSAPLDGAGAASDPGDAGLRALVRTATAMFAERFGGPPRWVAAAPGRVNLIGEYTDFNGGFVLPMAIDRYLVLAGAPAAGRAREAPTLRVHSATLGATAQIPLGAPLAPEQAFQPTWANYVRGVVAGFQRRGATVPALDVVAVSDVPVGGGLSSSAALEVATATLLEAATATAMDRLDKARLCRQAEHDYAGVPCGLMDQATAVLGDASGALLIDCQAEAARLVPLGDPAWSVLICNTNVRHALGDGAYARRRAECDEAARALGVASLRDATLEGVEAARAALGPVVHRRARHVVSENGRVLEAAAALGAGDLAVAGALMYESHRSLRDDFEVSCPELDTLVDLAREVGPAGGVLGARMTGGGFGGCAVALVRSDRVAAVTEALGREYRRRHGRALTCFVTRPARGAHLVAGSDAG